MARRRRWLVGLVAAGVAFGVPAVLLPDVAAHLVRSRAIPRLEERIGRRIHLGGVRVGRGAKVGAMSVVLRDVPPGAVAVGVPARIIERDMAGAAGVPDGARHVGDL